MQQERIVNAALLRETLAYIQEHPESWNQRTWGMTSECGTVACFAGWAAMLTDANLRPPAYDPMIFQQFGSYPPWLIGSQFVDDFATTLLGLTEDQGVALFDSSNTMVELTALVEAIIANPNIEEDDLVEVVGSAAPAEPVVFVKLDEPSTSPEYQQES